MEFQKTQHYDLMYTKTKELDYKAKREIKNIGIKDYEVIIMVHESK
jgi:hypothetical protein